MAAPRSNGLRSLRPGSSPSLRCIYYLFICYNLLRCDIDSLSEQVAVASFWCLFSAPAARSGQGKFCHREVHFSYSSQEFALESTSREKWPCCCLSVLTHRRTSPATASPLVRFSQTTLDQFSTTGGHGVFIDR